MSEPDKDLIQAIAEALEIRHWDGTGCGTHGENACSNCFGPSPMSAQEVAEVAAEVADKSVGKRISTLEEQVDLLRRALGLMTVSAAPTVKWLDASWQKVGK